MSDNPTQETPGSRSPEERVFARFDAPDGRLAALEETADLPLRETRPIREAVQTRLEGAGNGLEGLKQEVKRLTHADVLVREDNLHTRSDRRDFRQRAVQLESPSTR